MKRSPGHTSASSRRTTFYIAIGMAALIAVIVLFELVGSPALEVPEFVDLKSDRTSIAMSRTEITFAQYDEFALATGQQIPLSMGWGRGNQPVINVNWYDAVAYADWLGQVLDETVRLPTSKEWEIATGGNGDTKFAFGDCLTTDDANFDTRVSFADCDVESSFLGKPAPVGSYRANYDGLFDVHGNVSEWTSDCLAPSRTISQCDVRGIQGGSWGNGPHHLQLTQRGGASAEMRHETIGFRVVLESNPSG